MQTEAFVKFTIEQGALSFGEFELKSGRISPYFFDAGALTTHAQALTTLGDFYAKAFQSAHLNADVIFGPAYKGIPIALATAQALATANPNLGITFNRKEKKDHGEKGQLVGCPLKNKRVCIIDDVITAGTAIREVQPLIEAAGGEICGILLALDRQEKMHNDSKQSAIANIQKELQVPVISLITFEDIMQFCANTTDFTKHQTALRRYQEQFFIGDA